MSTNSDKQPARKLVAVKPDEQPVDKQPDWAYALDHRDRSWLVDLFARIGVQVGGISAILFIVAIFLFIGTEGFEFLWNRLSFSELLFGTQWDPTVEPPVYGAAPLIMGTAWITFVAMVIAVPLSFAAAVYVGEFARGKQREWLKIGIELLAAIPSVVWGVIGLHVMKPLIEDTFDVQVGLNVLNAGIILGLMAAPIIATIAEDALKAVPEGYREAAESLGATRWQVIWKVVLPHARPGLSAAVLLGVGRAFGETIAVLMASGHRLMIPESVFDSAATLTATIAAELGEAAVGGDHYQVLFVLGLLLFLITFCINLLADRIVRGRRAKA
ncbi:MAG: phosphate ABC transporter permease subunit PstC [bacterium]|nr:phosphate ABC transporter permease subunit PstC [bacterium]